MTMFLDFGPADSSQRQGAGDHVQASSIGILLEMPKKTLRYIVSGHETILKSTLENTDRENA